MNETRLKNEQYKHSVEKKKKNGYFSNIIDCKYNDCSFKNSKNVIKKKFRINHSIVLPDKHNKKNASSINDDNNAVVHINNIAENKEDEKISLKKKKSYSIKDDEEMEDKEKDNHKLTFWTSFCNAMHHKTIIYTNNNKFKQLWDKILVTCILFTAVEIPFYVSFHLRMTIYFELFVNLLLLADIWFCFRTSYLKNGQYVSNRNQIFRHYLETWFFWDFLSAFPAYLIAEFLFNEEFPPKIEVMLNLIHMLRILKLAKIIASLHSHVSQWKIIGVLAVVFLALLHWSACIWHELGNIYADAGWLFANDLLDSSAYERYIASIYWSATTITTVGYGDYHATTVQEQVFSLFMLVISAIVYASLLTIVSNIISSVFHNDEEYISQVDKGENIMKRLYFSNGLQQKIKLFLYHQKQSEKKDEIYLVQAYENLLHAKFSNNMKYQILIESGLHRLLCNNPLLSTVFNDNILLYFVEHLSVHSCLANDYLFQSHDICRNGTMYILKNGVIRIYSHEGDKSLCILRYSGTHFGEIPLMQSMEDNPSDKNLLLHYFSAECRTTTIYYTIKFEIMEQLMRTFPKLYEVMNEIAEERKMQTKMYDDSKLIKSVVKEYHKKEDSGGNYFAGLFSSIIS